MTTPSLIIVTEEEKRDALEKLLASASFRKHEQLQRFLRYVCELEMAGQSSGIHEYQIGVDVFGKPVGYSTGEDTTVRSRAHSVRKKLQEYYDSEAPDSLIRIEMPKGGYVPEFVRVEHSVAKAEAPVPRQPAGRNPWILVASAFVVGALVAALAVAAWTRSGPASLDPTIRDAWGPLLTPAASKTILFLASPAHLFVRRLPPDSAEIEAAGRPLGRHELPQSPEIREWFFSRYPDVPGTKPYLIPTHNSPLWGDSIGALTAVNLMARAGVEVDIVAERASTASFLRDRNAVVFGRPEYSPAAEFFLSGKPMSIEYSQSAKQYVLKAACGSEPARYYSDAAIQTGRARDDDRYGLVTVLSRSDGASSGTRIVHFSGLASTGTQAAAEYFTSPAQLRQLATKFAAQGLKGFPKSYQVLIRAKAISMLPVQMEYVSHCVIEP